MAYLLPETELLQLKEIARDGFYASFEIEPLTPGYGVTLANSLRRVLLASLPGAAATSIRVDGATHEFSTLTGVAEDVVEIILNIKSLRLKLMSDEPVTLVLDAKGPKVVRAADFKKNANVEIMNPDLHIATLDKKGRISLEITCEKGRGYVTTEMRRDEKLPLGTIAIDSIFTPIKKVHYQIENTRVGRMTNFDKIILDITTDGTVDPEDALTQASQILIDHFNVLAGNRVVAPEIEMPFDASTPVEEPPVLIIEEPSRRRKAKIAKATEETEV